MKCNAKCPVCGEGALTPKTTHSYVEYKGKSKFLPLHFSVCDYCEIEQTDQRESLENKREMNEFKKSVDGVLTGNEVSRARKKLGLTQLDAARVFGGGPVAFSKYESNDVTQSEAMDKLLRLAINVPEAYAFLLQQAGMNVNKAKIAVPQSSLIEAPNEWINISDTSHALPKTAKITDKIKVYEPHEAKRHWLEENAA
ncbi:type II toxin-antitoxin system MqsA family antitoxin [Rahnella variigena]|uniref:type II toxin-antitoxin system MqsA family antitoxin n=1 Tax=Rahnella variigena TaxID=574964 RepID=UPI00132F73F7|nr:type II toxin-antitoxin system MqsA family antitoxin [Rahnella variigena]